MWSTSCHQNKENRSLNEKMFSMENSYTTESERMRGELSRLRGVEEEAKNKTTQVSSLQEELERLRKELSTTQQEKKTIEDWAQTYRDEMETVSLKPAVLLGTAGVPLCVSSLHSLCLHIPGCSFSGYFLFKTNSRILEIVCHNLQWKKIDVAHGHKTDYRLHYSNYFIRRIFSC